MFSGQRCQPFCCAGTSGIHWKAKSPTNIKCGNIPENGIHARRQIATNPPGQIGWRPISIGRFSIFDIRDSSCPHVVANPLDHSSGIRKGLKSCRTGCGIRYPSHGQRITGPGIIAPAATLGPIGIGSFDHAHSEQTQIRRIIVPYMQWFQALRSRGDSILPNHSIGPLVLRKILEHLRLSFRLSNRTRKSRRGAEELIRSANQVVVEQVLGPRLVVGTECCRIVVERIVVDSVWGQSHVCGINCATNRCPFQVIRLPLVSRKIEPRNIVYCLQVRDIIRPIVLGIRPMTEIISPEQVVSHNTIEVPITPEKKSGDIVVNPTALDQMVPVFTGLRSRQGCDDFRFWVIGIREGISSSQIWRKHRDSIPCIGDRDVAKLDIA